MIAPRSLHIRCFLIQSAHFQCRQFIDNESEFDHATIRAHSKTRQCSPPSQLASCPHLAPSCFGCTVVSMIFQLDAFAPMLNNKHCNSRTDKEFVVYCATINVSCNTAARSHTDMHTHTCIWSPSFLQIWCLSYDCRSADTLAAAGVLASVEAAIEFFTFICSLNKKSNSTPKQKWNRKKHSDRNRSSRKNTPIQLMIAHRWHMRLYGRLIPSIFMRTSWYKNKNCCLSLDALIVFEIDGVPFFHSSRSPLLSPPCSLFSCRHAWSRDWSRIRCSSKNMHTHTRIPTVNVCFQTGSSKSSILDILILAESTYSIPDHVWSHKWTRIPYFKKYPHMKTCPSNASNGNIKAQRPSSSYVSSRGFH